MKKPFTFIDLFSGIGGFHQAMSSLGGQCVFASEIDKYCIETYQENYGMDSGIDIRNVDEKDIPPHDVLCAGFPCQAVSKAGKQEGLEDETRGTLFFEIVRILKHHHTPYIVLENVRNLVSHDHGNTWKVIRANLRKQGYRLMEKPLILSPHHFGVPQLRERVVILGKYEPDRVDEPLNIAFHDLMKKEQNSIYDVVKDHPVDEKYAISEHEEMVLNAWDEFYHGIDMKVIGFPIWSEFFRYEKAPAEFPAWKQEFVNKNIRLYQSNQKFIDQWLKKYNDLKDFTPTQRKMEWQAGTNIDSVWEGVIQLRPSGVRIKVPTCFPALVAIVQIPIIGRYKRRLTVEESAALQSFPAKFISNANDQQAYKQYGNSVNVTVIAECAKRLFDL